MSQMIGHISQVIGPVVDVLFVNKTTSSVVVFCEQR